MIFYILGGSILITFIACLIHYFSANSDISDFFIKDGGWVTIAMCLTVTLGVIGCIYLDFWLSLVITLTVIITFIICIYHYKESCSSDLWDFLVDDYGFVIILACLTVGGMIVGSVYWSVGWSLLIGLPIVVSISALSVYYDSTAAYDLKELLIDNCGWAFPLLFVSIAVTIASAILISVGYSLIIGITLIIMVISSMIHYSVEVCSGFKDFFLKSYGWLTNLVVLIIGLTVLSCVYINVGVSLYVGISAIIFIIACSVHYSEQSCSGFEDFFISEKGWITVSITLLVEISLFGFIFWTPAKTFILLLTLISMLVGAIIHWSISKPLDMEEFFYTSNGFLTLSIIGAVGYGVFALVYYSTLRAIIALAAIILSIVFTAIYKNKVNEQRFCAFCAKKFGIVIFTAPLMVGGAIIWIMYSKCAFFVVFTLLGLITYLVSLARLKAGGYYVQTTGSVTGSGNGADGSVIIDIRENGELVYRRR